jgi:hypothetical protein
MLLLTERRLFLALAKELYVNEGPADINNDELDFEKNTVEEVLEMELVKIDVLPPNMRCVAHLFNLVASMGAEKSFLDPETENGSLFSLVGKR